MSQYTLAYFLNDAMFNLICYVIVLILFITGICLCTVKYSDRTPEPTTGVILCFFAVFFLGALFYLKGMTKG